MDFDTASPDDLMRESREMMRKAAATGDMHRWAAQQQEAAVKRSIPIPVGDLGNIDWQEAELIKKRASARRELGNALEQSGLTERWRSEAALETYFSSLEGSGPLGRLMAGKRDCPELHAANIDQRKEGNANGQRSARETCTGCGAGRAGEVWRSVGYLHQRHLAR